MTINSLASAMTVLSIFLLTAASVSGQERPASALTDAEQTAVLAVHNSVRREVGKMNLSWDDDLASYAQAYANQLAESGGFDHEQSGVLQKLNHGENLHATTSSDRSYEINRCAKDWADERFEAGRSIYVPGTTYNQYKARYPDKMFGHWTQMIWGQTRKIGVGIARVKTGPRAGGYVVVARYFPSGNYINQAP